MKTILITEKPSVAGDYASVLHISKRGNGYIEGYSDILQKDLIITWAVGHLILLGSVDEQREHKIVKKDEELKWNQTKLPILPKPWFYKPSYQTLDQFKTIKSLYKQSDVDEIYYAGDSGREGIYIQALIRNMIFGDGTIESAHVPSRITEKVVWIDSYTEDEILRGIRTAKPYHHYDNMIAAGYERAIWDWLMGINFSRGYTKKANTLIATGRVMSPTLNMIVTRDAEIKAFIPTFYYGIKAELPGFNPIWKADKDSHYFESPLLYNETGFNKKEDAEKVITELTKDKRLTVDSVTATEKKETAPLLYNLADLQVECSSAFHIGPDETLSIAQSLYEKKLTTYPRTDARVLSSAVANELKNKGYTIPSKYIDDSKITDHYAIIPTFLRANGLSDIEQRVYNLISKRFMAITKAPYIYDTIKVKYSHSNGEHFYCDGKIDKSLGWKALYTEEMSTYQTPAKGTVLPVNNFNLNEGQTKAPTAYTTGTIVRAMEAAGKLIEDEELRAQIKSCGIGTSATRANIITKLQKNNYITVDKKQKITPTELGIELISVIKGVDSEFLNPEKTAELEQKLNEIAEGRLSVNSAHDLIEDYVRDTVSLIENSQIESLKGYSSTTRKSTSSTETYTCPYCNGELVDGKFGFWCKTNKDFKSFGGHKLSESDVKALISKGKTRAYNLTFQSGKSAKASIIKGTNGNELEFER